MANVNGSVEVKFTSTNQNGESVEILVRSVKDSIEYEVFVNGGVLGCGEERKCFDHLGDAVNFAKSEAVDFSWTE